MDGGEIRMNIVTVILFFALTPTPVPEGEYILLNGWLGANPILQGR